MSDALSRWVIDNIRCGDVWSYTTERNGRMLFTVGGFNTPDTRPETPFTYNIKVEEFFISEFMATEDPRRELEDYPHRISDARFAELVNQGRLQRFTASPVDLPPLRATADAPTVVG